MDPSEALVLVVCGLLIAGVVWWFFLSDKPRAVAVAAGGTQVFEVRVEGGYDPSQLVVRLGSPVRIEFYRAETDSCSETVVFGDFGVSKKLAPHRTTVVELTPTKAGTFGFQCGMGMLHGTLVVEDRSS